MIKSSCADLSPGRYGCPPRYSSGMCRRRWSPAVPTRTICPGSRRRSRKARAAELPTSGVVLSTLREAADRDFGLTVLADACLDNDPEVHRVLTEKVFPAQ